MVNFEILPFRSSTRMINTTAVSNESTVTLHHSSSTSFGAGHGFFNPQMSIGRDFAVLAALEHYHQLKSSLKERHTERRVDNTFRLLDGFSGVGALAIRWSSTLPLNVPSSPIEITANDRSPTCQQLIEKNIHTNI